MKALLIAAAASLCLMFVPVDTAQAQRLGVNIVIGGGFGYRSYYRPYYGGRAYRPYRSYYGGYYPGYYRPYSPYNSYYYRPGFRYYYR